MRTMTINYPRVRFTNVSDEQVSYGGYDDPRKHLHLGATYQLSGKIVHNYTTEYMLEGFEDFTFNSVHFEEIPDGTTL